jgi:FkbM family methyltransferase
MHIFIKIIQQSAKKVTSFLYTTKIGRLYMQHVIDEILRQNYKVRHNSVNMLFHTPNWLNHYRAKTFSEKEPETLEWIDSVALNSVVWDIGANVGIYSIYLAKLKQCRVYAFEPSVFNLEFLTRNIFLNGLQYLITVVPLSLSNHVSENLFRMSSTQWGGALSTFGENLDQLGNEFKEVFEYKTIGISMDQAVSFLNLPFPDHIKIDVDGIEHFILSGGSSVLLNVKSVLVEINDDFDNQSVLSTQLLKDAGLVLYKKCFEGVPNGLKQYNQWWTRETL